MSFIDKKDAAVIREFINKTRTLSIQELSDFFNNESYLNIKGFSKSVHLDLIFDVVMEDRGFNIKDLMEDDSNKINNIPVKTLEVKHSITLVFTEPSLQMVNKHIVRIPFEHGKPTVQSIDEYLALQNLKESVHQSNGTIETIVGETHIVDHVFYVFISDMKKLQSFLSVETFNSIDKNIWLQHISKLGVLSFDKKYITKLEEMKKKIKDK